jgi:shikimate kinase
MSRQHNVILVGPMGAGKSTIGRHVAELLHKQFLDTDHVIEARTGATIPLVFEIEGEPGFRRREAAVIDELTRQDNLVLATGGGAVLSADNRRVLRERGIVVYLCAPLDTLVERTQKDRNRPLLQNTDRREKLAEILRVRDPLYRETAHIVVHTARRSPLSVAREIATEVKKLETDDEDAHRRSG